MPHPDADDLTVALLKRGDQEGLARLVRDHGALIKARLRRDFGRRLDASEIEDVMQAMLVRVWRAAERFDSRKGTLRAWATVIARNCARRMVETSSRGAAVDSSGLEDVAARDPAPLPTAPERRRLRADLLRCIQRLPGLQRVVLLADHACGDSAPAAALATQLGTSTNAIYVARRKGKKSLRQALEALGHDFAPASTKVDGQVPQTIRTRTAPG